MLSLSLPRLLDLRSPPLNALSLATNRHTQLNAVHALCIFQKVVTRHTSRIRPIHRKQLQHRQQELPNLLTLLRAEMILLVEDVRKSPVS
jgi:hypothetical protein